MAEDSKHKQDDGIPILTDIVKREDLNESQPDTPAEHDTEQEDTLPIESEDADDNIDPDLKKTETTDEPDSSRSQDEDQVDPPGLRAVKANLSKLRSGLINELDNATDRIVEEAVLEAETLIVERVSKRLKNEMHDIINTTLADFELKRK